MKRLILTALIAVMITGTAEADVGTATTGVYVRSLESGEVVGSLHKGDKVAISDKKGNWYKVCIGGKDYKVFANYLDISGESVDDVRGDDAHNKSSDGRGGSAGRLRIAFGRVVHGAQQGGVTRLKEPEDTKPHQNGDQRCKQITG